MTVRSEKQKSMETKHDITSHFDKNWKCSMTWIQMGIQNTRCPSIFWKTSLNETLHSMHMEIQCQDQAVSSIKVSKTYNYMIIKFNKT